MRRSDQRSSGMTLPELLLGVVLLGLIAAVAVGGTSRSLARLRVEAAARQLAVALEQARTAAESTGQPCALALDDGGWREAQAGELIGELPPCPVAEPRLQEAVRLRHNLPGALRIASNGLVLDGGTVVIGAAGTDLQRCLVVALPLGVVRSGRSNAAPGAAPRSSDCVVDPSL
jgi:prepilin-type N-terminal cleavage/methylation domain-containing protein